MKCQNCGHIYQGNFCHNCGQKSGNKRIDSKYVIYELPNSIFQLNSGILFTIKNLFLRPGESIHEFIEGKRRNYVKPIAFVFITSTILILINAITKQNFFVATLTVWNMFLDSDILNGDVSPQLTKYFPYINVLLVPIFSQCSYLIFKKSKLNYFEHIVLNSYVAGQQMLVYSVLDLFIFSIGIQDSANLYALQILGLIAGFTYLFWVYQQFFYTYKALKKTLLFLLTNVFYILMSILYFFLFTIYKGYMDALN